MIEISLWIAIAVLSILNIIRIVQIAKLREQLEQREIALGMVENLIAELKKFKQA